MANKTAEITPRAPTKPVAEMSAEERADRIYEIAQIVQAPDPELNDELNALFFTPLPN